MSQPSLPFRQVHLDFHTHGLIPGIGAQFCAETFADTLVKARINSINLFARCHHGYLYYDSRKFPQYRHPHLQRDLLREQMEACRARGIRTPVYLSIQWDALMAEAHPEWLVRDEYGKTPVPTYAPGFYNSLCLNTPYENYLRELVSEVLDDYPADGFWLDILMPQECSCRACRGLILANGGDPSQPEERMALACDTLTRFKREMSELIRGKNPECLVFYNSGHVGPWVRRELDAFSHLEVESLPSGQWGYGHFPVTARYARTLGKELLGMTGKFHTAWGDFHSFKNPEALSYECFSMLAHNVKCSIGDQLHPNGVLCPHTYELIGTVYREVERREPWCEGAVPVVEIGLLTPEGLDGWTGFGGIPGSVKGAVRLLQELHHQFDIIDTEADFGAYRLLIIPDEFLIAAPLARKLEAYLAAGGAIIASHRAGLKPDRSGFALLMGVAYRGDAAFAPQFVKPREVFRNGLRPTEQVIYLGGSAVEAEDGAEVLADAINPYFNRTWQHYCSHMHAPSSGEVGGPAVIRSGRCIYFAHPVFAQYGTNAPRWCRAMVANALDLLLPGPRVRVPERPGLLVTLNEQKAENRMVLHLLYGAITRNNETIEIIDEIIPLSDIPVSLKVDGAVEEVRCVPEGSPLPFARKEGRIEFILPRLNGYQMICVSRPA